VWSRAIRSPDREPAYWSAGTVELSSKRPAESPADDSGVHGCARHGSRHAQRAPDHGELGGVDNELGGHGQSLGAPILDVRAELDRHHVPDRLQGALADQRRPSGWLGFGNGYYHVGVVFGVEELGRAQVRVPLLVLVLFLVISEAASILSWPVTVPSEPTLPSSVI
jgi:hypothetical protein